MKNTLYGCTSLAFHFHLITDNISKSQLSDINHGILAFVILSYVNIHQHVDFYNVKIYYISQCFNW